MGKIGVPEQRRTHLLDFSVLESYIGISCSSGVEDCSHVDGKDICIVLRVVLSD